MKGIRLRHLAFTGPGMEPATLDFVDGLNIIYGASNTGKSFTSDALLFVLGATGKLRATDEIKTYTGVWLGLTLADEGQFTLYRATRGGSLKLFPGLITSHPTGKGQVLLGQHSATKPNTVSRRLLETLGLQDRWLVRNAAGTKESLPFRLLAKFAVVGEEDIISTRSPVYVSDNVTERTLDRNLFKLLLTGQDDAAVVESPTEPTRIAAKAGKLELIDQLLAQIDRDVGDDPARQKDHEAALGQLDADGAMTTARLQEVQAELDEISTLRRDAIDRQQDLQARAGELDITLERFAKLQAVYRSDLERLHSLEEGGTMLAAIAVRDCPACGAPPGAQLHHHHAAEELALAHAAAAAEARKIEREQRELTAVMDSLQRESAELQELGSTLTQSVVNFDLLAQALRPSEASLRSSFAQHNAQRADLVRFVDLHKRQQQLRAMRVEIEAASTKNDRDPLPVGPGATALFAFGETVKAVLTAWGFPDADKVQFDEKANDITIAGKARDANGKGVRAVMHAAFTVALALHCIGMKRPHPGFLVLDTPLLTYREPLKSKHGDLSDDEKVLKATSLAEKFYRHLASLEGELQVIIIENSDPPDAVVPLAHIEVFTGEANDGRYGLLAR